MTLLKRDSNTQNQITELLTPPLKGHWPRMQKVQPDFRVA
jgi:hypothetical protein